MNEPAKERQARLFQLMLEHPDDVYKAAREDMERALFTEVMKFTRNNQSQATRILGINRGTLRTKLAKYYLI